MPRNQGTSRKGKPKKADRAAGMGRALQKSQRPGAGKGGGGRKNKKSTGGMAATTTISIGMNDKEESVPKSVLEMDHLEDFLVQANLAGRQFESEKERYVILDSSCTEFKGQRGGGGGEIQWANGIAPPPNKFQFEELSVPRRPEWNKNMSAKELETIENNSFLEWRRLIASKEEHLFASNQNNNTTVTPFEKNLDVWRQLWRVLERCSCIVQVVDARNPLFYLSEDLRKYATEELGKPMILIVNKSDYLSNKQRKQWSNYLKNIRGWDHVFFSAHNEQQKLDDKAALIRKQEEELMLSLQEKEEGEERDEEKENVNEDLESDLLAQEKDSAINDKSQRNIDDNIGIEDLLNRKELIDFLYGFAKKHGCEPDNRFDDRIQFGMVGFPNVGKSSVINVLVGSSKHQHGVVRVGVAAQPGKTKHFQTLFLPDNNNVMLCDCPGLVFPSFVSSTADLIAAGVYPIAQMRDHWSVIGLITQRIPRQIFNAQYGIKIPEPSTFELIERGILLGDEDEKTRSAKIPPPTAEELLSTYCVARSMLATSSGIPDYQRAARVIITDYVSGKLLHCNAPPNIDDVDDFDRETIITAMHNTRKFRNLITKDVKRREEDGKPVETDLLELIGTLTTKDEKEEQSKSRIISKRSKKYGKKGKKYRSSDPYGCHTDPDELMNDGEDEGVISSGLIVSSGKKYGKKNKKGYTRPIGYASTRRLVTGAGTQGNEND